MILDRLRAQPELMEALGVCFWHESLEVRCGPKMAAIQGVDLANDDCPGSALLLVRCRDWLLAQLDQEREAFRREDGSYNEARHGYILAGLHIPIRTMSVSSVLLAVLEVAEGK